MGKVKKGQICSINNCASLAVRSLSQTKLKTALTDSGLKLKTLRGNRVYLCEKHYKILKKAMKKDRKIEKWRYTTF